MSDGLRFERLYGSNIAEREALARTWGDYDWITLCAVQRPTDHPMRPAAHQPLEAVWEHFGYTRWPHLVASFRWRDIGDTQETEKPLVFWIKRL